jgi:oxygen-dependent protoporphyrinogen oxidase
VVGGGISGLAAAWELAACGTEVTVFEAGRLGGCLLTEDLAGVPVDLGPDAFLTRLPAAVELCREVGLGGELEPPSAGTAQVWVGGRLHPFPDGLLLGVPRRLGALATSGVLSPLGVARAGLDLVLPATPPGDGATVRSVVAARFGAEVADRLVAPLVGSIYAGDIARLGAAETIPQVVSAGRSSRSLLRALRRLPPPPPGPAFLRPRGGLGRLVEALAGRLRAREVRFVQARVDGPVRSVGGRFEVAAEIYDAVVVAVPAPVAASLLGGDSGQALSRVPVASVALLVAVVEGFEPPAGLNGFVVAPGEGRLVTACSYGSNKWPEWRAAGPAVIRISAGRDGDERAATWSLDRLAERMLAEVEEALGRRLGVTASRLVRWSGAFPQYRPGHSELIRVVQEDLARHRPGLAVAGSVVGGVGIPACVTTARRAARFALAGAGREGEPPPARA